MKIFDSTEQWPSKTNFVDEQNVLLGFDREECCCENADWFISDSEKPYSSDVRSPNHELPDAELWRFDLEYFAQRDHCADETPDSTILDCGGIATFRIVNDRGDQKFIHLFNCQNGYYSHGFTFSVGDQGIREGSV